MKRSILFLLLGIMSLVCNAQDFLASGVTPATANSGAKHLYTNRKVVFTLEEKEDDVALTVFLIAPDGKKFKSSKAHVCKIDLCTADGGVIKSINYYTHVQGKNDRLYFYDDSILGYHTSHSVGDGHCDCYSKQVFKISELWNFVCEQDGFVRMTTETKDGEVETSFWTLLHKAE